MPSPGTQSIPAIPVAPAGEIVPAGPYLALIQWTFDTHEACYGPATRAAVANLQRQHGIPVDANVMIGPRTWSRILEVYERKVKAARVPSVPAAFAGEMIPAGPYLTLIQWTFGTGEEGYGPATRAAVADLQHQYGIPVDSHVMIGPRTWTRILEAYRRKVAAMTPWVVPAQPYRLDGARPEEQYLRKAIDRLNGQLVPAAAAYYVRNKRIAAMKAAGQPPKAEVPVPPAGDPEVVAAAAQLAWNQAKVDKLWARACAIGIDPRVMLACLFQEGTGSFDTNGAVPTQFWNGARYLAGGSGVQPDFEQDLASAMEHHILAKVRAYGTYAAAFREAVMSNGLGDGNLFQYVNWVVPWVKSAGWSVRPGCYATHTEWWRGLQRYFDGMAGVGATQAYSAYLTSHPAPADVPAPAVKFVLTYNGTGPTDYDLNHPWIEAVEA